VEQIEITKDFKVINILLRIIIILIQF